MEEEEVVEEEESGARATIRKHGPRQPGGQERIEHEMTHVLFWSQCRH